MSNDHVSASQIKRHAKCPEQYRLRYIEDLEATKQKKGYGELGGLVHESIENVLNENPSERNRSRLTGMLKQEFYSLEDSGEYDTEIIDEKQRSDGLDCLEVAARFISKQSFDIRAIEKFFKFRIDSFGEDALGYIDLVTQNEIWDWKTGRIRDDTDRDEVIQGAVYMGGYFNEYGEMPEAIRFVYLKEEKVRTVNPDEDNWDRMLEYARELVNAGRRDYYPPDPEESKCYFCGFENYCSASAVSPGQIREELEENPDLWGEI